MASLSINTFLYLTLSFSTLIPLLTVSLSLSSSPPLTLCVYHYLFLLIDLSLYLSTPSLLISLSLSLILPLSIWCLFSPLPSSSSWTRVRFEARPSSDDGDRCHCCRRQCSSVGRIAEKGIVSENKIKIIQLKIYLLFFWDSFRSFSVL